MTKTTYITARAAAALLTLALAVAPVSAKKSSARLDGRPSSGFNALDHVLQKPLGNPSFPEDERGFGNHIFLGLNVGGSAIGNNFSGSIKPGARAGGQIGGWFTPVHGFRLAADAGLHSVHEGAVRTWFGAVKADYLMNFSALLRGYDPMRRFELIGAVGLEYQRLRQNGVWSNGYGIGASLQMRFNVAPSFFLYLEPRLAMMAGTQYDTRYNWYRMHADLSLNLGLGYRILTGRLRRLGATDFTQINDDNLYFGAGAGLFTIPRNGAGYKNPMARVFAGKMFSSASGLQVGLNFGQLRPGNGAKNKYMAIGSLDYVLNLNSAFGGYRPDEVFQMSLNAGVAGAMVTRGNSDGLAPGIGVGLTGMFRLSPNWGIFIHPQVYAFTSRFTDALGFSRAPLASVDLGLRYTIGDFSRLHPGSYEDYEGAKHWFLTAGFGGAARVRGDYGPGADAFVGFGKRFTPVSSWRLTLRGDVFPRTPLAAAGTLHADYLSSITTAMLGYDPDRLFDLQLVLGAFAGAANYEGPITYTYGLTSGLQANFRLNEHLDLYVEPQILAANAPKAGGAHGWIPEARVQIGLRYKLGTPAGGLGSIFDTPYGDGRNFAGISAAPSVFSGTMSSRDPNITGALDLHVGRWFSTVSALRFVYANDWLHNWKKTHYIGSAHIDYLLNVTSLMDRSTERRFHIIGAAGGGVAFCGTSGTKAGPMAYGGVQFRYNLPANIDIHIEPGAQIFPRRVIPQGCGNHRIEMTGRLAVGASYRF
ncbi:MAG: hypothetical protein K2K36_04050 [Muribaculaceae bacterium]|nr:hypothetical protein [Muribaculaceae bacterium]